MAMDSYIIIKTRSSIHKMYLVSQVKLLHNNHDMNQTY